MLKENPVKGKKYNYALEIDVQNFYSYECTIQLDENEEELIVKNLKPNHKNGMSYSKSSSSCDVNDILSF